MYQEIQSFEEITFENQTLVDIKNALFQKYNSKDNQDKFHACMSIVLELEVELLNQSRKLVQK